MPQLDKVTFLSQFFWVSFFYIGFYFVLLRNFLPKISRILKLRKRKTSLSGEDFTLFGKEGGKVAVLSDTLFRKGFTLSKSFLADQSAQFSLWLEKVKKKNNHTVFHPLNTDYLESVSEGIFLENLNLSEIEGLSLEKEALVSLLKPVL